MGVRLKILPTLCFRVIGLHKIVGVFPRAPHHTGALLHQDVTFLHQSGENRNPVIHHPTKLVRPHYKTVRYRIAMLR